MERLRKIGIFLLSLWLFLSILILILFSSTFNNLLNKYFYYDIIEKTDFAEEVREEFRTRLDTYVLENDDIQNKELVYDEIFKIVDEDFIKAKTRTLVNELNDVFIEAEKDEITMDFAYEKGLLQDAVGEEVNLDEHINDVSKDIPLINENLEVELNNYVDVEVARKALSLTKISAYILLPLSIIMTTVSLIVLTGRKSLKEISLTFLAASITSLIALIILSVVISNNIPFGVTIKSGFMIMKFIPLSVIGIIISIIMLVINYKKEHKLYY